MGITGNDLNDLRYAKTLIENPGMAAKLTHLIGRPIEKSFEFLPARWSNAVQHATMSALNKALRFAVLTMGKKKTSKASNRMHRMIVSATGGTGGALGLAGLTMELPISTIVMLRSIADIARSEGEHIEDPEVKLACLEVFALGGRSKTDNAAETGYFAVRAALARSVTEAAKYIAQKEVVDKSAPVIVRFMAQVASRFQLTVSQKMAAQAVPIIGAASGVLINRIFLDHFQEMARGHFIIRRLERIHGRQQIKAAYEKL